MTPCTISQCHGACRILYPPGCVPPGVHPSPDGADVATPLSLVEWFLNFYDAIKTSKVKPIECVVNAGEMIFVPSGWWHLAINLEESLAVTQNYVSSANLAKVLKFLRPGRSDLVSGCSMEERSNLHERFTSQLQVLRPEVMRQMQEDQVQKERLRKQDSQLSALFNSSSQNHVSKQQADAGIHYDGSPPPASKPSSVAGFTFSFGLAE